MAPVDLLDRKLLFELDNNSRQSFSQLAKKLHTSPQVITYRINRLKEEGIITSFMTALSTLSIGLPIVAKLYVQLSGITRAKEEDIFSFLSENAHVNWVCKTVGEYDIFTAVMVKEFQEFADFRRDFFVAFGDYVNHYEISFIDKAYTLPRNYLVNRNTPLPESRLIHKTITSSIAEEDKKILRLIADDSRLPAVAIAKTLNRNIKTVMTRLNHLEDSGAIQGYRINIDRKKLGIHYYKVFIKIRSFDIQGRKSLLTFCLAQKYLIHLIECIGKYEIELEMEMPTIDSMQSVVKDIRNQYASIIESISITEIIEEMKLTWLPKSF